MFVSLLSCVSSPPVLGPPALRFLPLLFPVLLVWLALGAPVRLRAWPRPGPLLSVCARRALVRFLRRARVLPPVPPPFAVWARFPRAWGCLPPSARRAWFVRFRRSLAP